MPRRPLRHAMGRVLSAPADPIATAIAAINAYSPAVFYYGSNYAAGVWTDRSSNGRNSTSLGVDPTLTTDNSDAALSFVIASVNGIGVPATVFPSSFTNATIYVVCKRTVTGTLMQILSKDGNALGLAWTAANQVQFYMGGSANFVRGPSIGADVSDHIICCAYDGTQGTAVDRGNIFYDDMTTGVTKTLGGTPGASITAATSMSLGRLSSGTTPMTGLTKAFIIFNGVTHNSTQRNDIKAQLGTLLNSV